MGESKVQIPREKMELPSFIHPSSAQEYYSMISEWENAKKEFERGAYSEAKHHISQAKHNCISLDGIAPFIVGTYLIKLSNLEKEIDSKNISFSHKFT